VFWGSDENLLLGLSFGVTAAIGSTYNVAIPHYKKLAAAFEAGDIDQARALQGEALRMVEVMLPYGVMQSLKEVQKLTGFEIGGVRPPFASLSEADAATMIKDIKALNIIEA